MITDLPMNFSIMPVSRERDIDTRSRKTESNSGNRLERGFSDGSSSIVDAAKIQKKMLEYNQDFQR